MDYAAFLRLQAAALVQQFFADDQSAWIGVPDLGSLTTRHTLHGGNIFPLPGAGAVDAVIWRDAKDRPELWVRPERKADEGTGAYASAWRQFVRFAADTAPVANLDGRAFAVDHLYPETAGARLGLAYVRVMAVDRRSNSLLGSTTERAAAGAKIGVLRVRKATYLTLAKVSGFQGSFARRNDSTALAQALLSHLRAQGYPVPGNALTTLEESQTASSIDWFRGNR